MSPNCFAICAASPKCLLSDADARSLGMFPEKRKPGVTKHHFLFHQVPRVRRRKTFLPRRCSQPHQLQQRWLRTGNNRFRPEVHLLVFFLAENSGQASTCLGRKEKKKKKEQLEMLPFHAAQKIRLNLGCYLSSSVALQLIQIIFSLLIHRYVNWFQT